MQDKVEPTNSGNTERIELVAKCAEELSLMIQRLNTTLTRGEFEDLRNLLSEIKQCVTEIENHLSILDSKKDD
ncbi:MAG: hypothetical protein QXR44_04175 [Thermoproteota archaeon]